MVALGALASPGGELAGPGIARMAPDGRNDARGSPAGFAPALAVGFLGVTLSLEHDTAEEAARVQYREL